MPTSTQNDRNAFPGANAALTLLILINLFNYIDRYVLAAVVGPIKKTFFETGGKNLVGSDALVSMIQWAQRHLGFTPDDALLGLLGTSFMLVYMLGAPLFARLADRWSRWAIISLGIILWSIASGASGIAGTFFILLITRCFVGIGEAAYGPVAPAMISDLFPLKTRGRALAWFYTATPVGSALGYVLGGVVANSEIGKWGAAWFGMEPESWRWAFLIVLAPGIILGARSYFMRDSLRSKQGIGQSKDEERRDVRWRDYLILIHTPSYMFCTFGMAAMTFAMGGIAFWMPYYLAGRPNAPSNSTIIFGAISAAAGLVATLLGGIAGDKLRGRLPGSYFLVSGIAMIAGFPIFLAVLHAPFPWAIWIMIFLACFCLFFNTGPTNTILANVTHPSIRAAGFALNILIIHTFGDVISPVIIGFLNDWYGDMNKSFLLVGFMFLVAGALWLAGIRYLQRDTDRAERLDFRSTLSS
jgi:MFS transporter, Spinster family, sphingosine-1-phosphate transporter